MFHHITVLKQETVDGLNVRHDGIYVDCTLGGAGHSLEIASRLSDEGLLIGFDQDEQAIAAAKQRLSDHLSKVRFVQNNFRYLREELAKLGITHVDGILYDLGVSSPQLDEADRGFSYQHDAELDMRMNRSSALTASTIVNEWSEQEIASILHRYGEEKYARRIAKRIVEARKTKKIASTYELAELVKEGIPAAARRTGPHPAKRSFQAIRIAVNDELGALEDSLSQAVDCLAPGGRICVISFHSLEDRITKQFFANFVERCTCPPDFPVCVCRKQGTLKVITRKPIVPSEQELEHNMRSRSAKLRIAEKLNKDVNED